MNLDKYDLKILDAVQRNARVTKASLSEQVGLSATACWTRLRRLEQRGVVVGYGARIVHRKIGPISTILVQITLGSHRQSAFDRFERAIKRIPEVITCWSVGGGVDYFLQIATRDIDAYQRLIEEMLESDIGIDRYFTYVVIKVPKDDSVPAVRLFTEGGQ